MKEFFHREIRALEPIREFPWQDARAYAEFLAQTYYYVCHTTRLLGVCASRIGIDREKLHHRFLKHAAEERSHHLLADRDIGHLGFSLANISELPITAALYETQYFRAEHICPTTIFGYIFALEGLSVVYGGHVYQAVEKYHGEKACSFVKLHANEDPDHLDATFQAVNGLPEAELRLIEANFTFTCQLYRSFLVAIRERAASATLTKA